MLQLRSNSWEFDNLISSDYKRFDYYITGRTYCQTVGYVRPKYIESALAPIAFNDLGIDNRTYVVTSTDENTDSGTSQEELIDNFKRDIEEKYRDFPQNKIGIYRIYSSYNSFEDVYNSFSGDLYASSTDVISSLYNKCMEQVSLREELDRTARTKIKLLKGKNIVLVFSDYNDELQASDQFLTIGLIPILFPNLKERFNDVELEYFKTLVNRSQVKRISNVKATEIFRLMCSTEKYEKIMSDMKLIMSINNIVLYRTSKARNKVLEQQRTADEYLRSYTRTMSEYYEACDLLHRLENREEDMKEEIRSALAIEGIVDVSTSNSNIMELFKTPVSYYNIDEVECMLAGMTNTPPAVCKFFNDVFIEQKYKLWILNSFTFNFDDNAFTKPGMMNANDLIKYNCWFNPHTNYYNCIGSYEPELRRAYADKDLLMYNNIAIAITKSINFRDGAVMNRWKQTLSDMVRDRTFLIDVKCFEDKEGNMYSFKELFLDDEEEL